MTSGLITGINAMGHSGWVKFKCRICARVLIVSRDPIYHCPKCKDINNSYFCEADFKRLHGKCPFCKTELKPLLEF